MIKRRHALAATALLTPSAWAQPTATSGGITMPNRPIRYIVPVAAGGGSDLVGRTVCERWARALGHSIVVENIGGGGGVIASQTTAKAAPDGATLMQGYVATHGTAPATRKLPYDPIKDFTPVGMIGTTPNVLVVNASLGITELKGFVDHLKRNPAKLSYGSSGNGSLTQMVMELFKQQSQTFILHVPYRGIAPAFNDLLGGQTQAMFPGLAAALPHIRSGRVRPLAVTGLQRHPSLPDVPTLIESGFKGFDAVQWYGVVGPPGMSPALVRHYNDTLGQVLRASDLKDKLTAEAIDPLPMTPAAFGQYIRAEVERWTILARERRITLDD
ncbi:MAG: tripartite tricarboxylate transporter substrate binding protein [Burkholderiales bacterium]|jgi:tripartite-type tricarboxylate transporter receptor subunit TctC|nr:tripartite tricarboxylate transporter substrate binding protein [Burkholderiales bacterium]NBO75993.1 tripartite tricarboxylate transporter substrate binding protein [Betaproteobacteria bacterium]